MKQIILSAAALLAVACTSSEEAVAQPVEETTEAKVAVNALSEAEVAEGWELMFDGAEIKNWRNYGTETIGGAWKVDDSSLHLDASNKEDWQVQGGGDILFVNNEGVAREFTDFHFKVDWRIAEKGNSGIMYLVHEEPETYPYPWMTGLEMQVLDNGTDSTEGHPDASIHKHRAGDLYDINACAEEVVHLAGEWNTAEVIVKDGHLQHILNGTVVVDRQLFDEQWTADVAASKFHEFPGYGTFQTGGIALQDHGDNVWYRNIKIKSLD